jgi:hypothetical protein
MFLSFMYKSSAQSDKDRHAVRLQTLLQVEKLITNSGGAGWSGSMLVANPLSKYIFYYLLQMFSILTLSAGPESSKE